MRAVVAVSESGTWHVDPASLRHLVRTVVMAVSDPSHCIHRLLSQSLQNQPCRRVDAVGAKALHFPERCRSAVPARHAGRLQRRTAGTVRCARPKSLSVACTHRRARSPRSSVTCKSDRFVMIFVSTTRATSRVRCRLSAPRRISSIAHNTRGMDCASGCTLTRLGWRPCAH